MYTTSDMRYLEYQIRRDGGQVGGCEDWRERGNGELLNVRRVSVWGK